MRAGHGKQEFGQAASLTAARGGDSVVQTELPGADMVAEIANGFGVQKRHPAVSTGFQPDEPLD